MLQDAARRRVRARARLARALRRASRRETERVRDELRALLERLRDEGKTVHVYGASTKGNTILQYVELDRR